MRVCLCAWAGPRSSCDSRGERALLCVRARWLLCARVSRSTENYVFRTCAILYVQLFWAAAASTSGRRFEDALPACATAPRVCATGTPNATRASGAPRKQPLHIVRARPLAERALHVHKRGRHLAAPAGGGRRRGQRKITSRAPACARMRVRPTTPVRDHGWEHLWVVLLARLTRHHRQKLLGSGKP